MADLRKEFRFFCFFGRKKRMNDSFRIYPHRAHQVNTLGEQELVISLSPLHSFALWEGRKKEKIKAEQEGLLRRIIIIHYGSSISIQTILLTLFPTFLFFVFFF
jgi:hypothetical protein